MRTALVLLALVALVTAGCDLDGAAAEGSFQKTLTVSGPAEVDVKTGTGNIRTRTGEVGSVQVQARIRAGNGWLGGGGDPEERVRRLEKDPPIEQNGNVIRIGHIADRDLQRNVSIHYELVVPAETRMRSSTGSGDQTIDGVRGPVTAATGSGNILMSNIAGEVRATTGSGDVKLEPVQGPASVTTGSGNIRVRQTAPGDVEARTGSGDIHLDGVKGGLRARSGSGNVEVDGEPTARWSVEAGSGTLGLRLPAQAAFDVYARTGSGEISLGPHPVTAGSTDGEKRKRELRGKVRGGGVMLDLRTGSGDIRFR